MDLVAERDVLEAGVAPAGPAHAALVLQLLRVPLGAATLEASDWRVRAGERVALIGPNGAGKTSILEALLGLRRGAVVQGEMLGVGIDEWRRRPKLRERLGVQLQRAAMPSGLKVADIIALQRGLFERTSQLAMERLGIAALSAKPYERLSGGEARRVDLFIALAHEPAIALLDEPFAGLDPHFARSAASLIGEMPGMTVLMACHTTEELRLATQVAWIANRTVLRCEAPDVLRHELVGEFRLVVECASDGLVEPIAARIARAARLARAPRLAERRVTAYGGEALSAIARTLVDQPGTLAVEFGHTSPADLLHRCAQEP
jgi:ABC-2 type transport system ATP-binding protein